MVGTDDFDILRQPERYAQVRSEHMFDPPPDVDLDCIDRMSEGEKAIFGLALIITIIEEAEKGGQTSE